MLEAETRFFEENQAKWKEQSPGKFALVKGAELIGFFDTLDEALVAGVRQFGLTPFLVRGVDEAPVEVRIPAMVLGVLHADPAFAV